MIKVLHIDPDAGHHEFIKYQLSRIADDIELDNAATLRDTRSLLQETVYDCIVCDDQPEDSHGIRLFYEFREDGCLTPFIFCSDQDIAEGKELRLPGSRDDEYNVLVNYGCFDLLNYWIHRLVNRHREYLKTVKLQQEIFKGPPERIAKLQQAVKTLTKRELEILNLIAEGNTNKDIAVKLNISYRTAVNHVYNLFSKLDIHSRAEAIHFAVSLKIAGER